MSGPRRLTRFGSNVEASPEDELRALVDSAVVCEWLHPTVPGGPAVRCEAPATFIVHTRHVCLFGAPLPRPGDPDFLCTEHLNGAIRGYLVHQGVVYPMTCAACGRPLGSLMHIAFKWERL